ncbi:hypothetical protein CLOP_g17613, partial [Closterium sp. NIES-67]
ETTR